MEIESPGLPDDEAERLAPRPSQLKRPPQSRETPPFGLGRAARQPPFWLPDGRRARL